jgi:hypothetical protein
VIVQVEGYGASAALKWYSALNGANVQIAQLAFGAASGGPVFNLSGADTANPGGGAPNTGAYTTGNRGTLPIADCFWGGKSVSDAFVAVKCHDAGGNTFVAAEANVFDASWMLLRGNQTASTLEASVTVTGTGSSMARVWTAIGGGTGTPGGVAGSVQFNKGGALSGDNFLTYDSATQILSVKEIDASFTINADSGYYVGGGTVIDNTGAFVATAGVVTSGPVTTSAQVTCRDLSVSASWAGPGGFAVAAVSGNVTTDGTINTTTGYYVGGGTVIDNTGAFVAVAGVVTSGPITTSAQVTCRDLSVSGTMSITSLSVTGLITGGSYAGPGGFAVAASTGNVTTDGTINTTVGYYVKGGTMIDNTGAFVGAAGVNTVGPITTTGAITGGTMLAATFSSTNTGSYPTPAAVAFQTKSATMAIYSDGTVAAQSFVGNGGFVVAITGNVTTNGTINTTTGYYVKGGTMIDSTGAFVGAAGVNTAGPVTATGAITGGSFSGPGGFAVASTGNLTTNGTINTAGNGYYINGGTVINSSYQFVGTGGVNTSGSITGGSYAGPGGFAVAVTSGNLTTNGTINTATGYYVNGGTIINSSGQFVGAAGVNTSGSVTCGSLSVTGTFSVASLSVTGLITGGSYAGPGGFAVAATNGNLTTNGTINTVAGYYVNGGTIINSSGAFVATAGVNTSGAIVTSNSVQLVTGPKANEASIRVLFTSATSDGANQMQAWVAMYTSATGTSRRLSIQAADQGIAWRNITLNENGGFVGICLATPQQALDIAGNMSATGTINGNGGYYVNGGTVINNSYQFVGTGGVNTSGGVTCSSLSVSGTFSVANLSVSGAISGGSYAGPGGFAVAATTGNLTTNGTINSNTGYYVNGGTIIASNGQFVAAAGVSTTGTITTTGTLVANDGFYVTAGVALISNTGQFVGAQGMNTSGYANCDSGFKMNQVQVIGNGSGGAPRAFIGDGGINTAGTINTTSNGYYINGGTVINNSYQFVGAGGVSTSGPVTTTSNFNANGGAGYYVAGGTAITNQNYHYGQWFYAWSVNQNNYLAGLDTVTVPLSNGWTLGFSRGILTHYAP